MQLRLVVATGWIEALQTSLGSGSTLVAAGIGRRADGSIELIVPSVLELTDTNAAVLRVSRLPRYLRGTTHGMFHPGALASVQQELGRTAPLLLVDLALLTDGGCSACWHHPDGIRPVHEIFLSGARLARWIPGEVRRDDPPPILEDGPFSRLAGGLGDLEALRRGQRLSLALIGCSRNGSLLAHGFARFGVGDLVLVDHDEFEEHLRDAMEVMADAEPGAPKVAELQRFLSAVAPHTRVRCVRSPIQHPDAWHAVAGADVIVAAPDDNVARLATTLLASAYGKVLLEVGSGVLERNGQRVAGADVRLVLPGEGCLACIGGLDLTPRPADGWRSADRIGSLRSLNQAATAQAQLFFEGLVTGRLRSSAWCRMRLDEANVLTVERRPLRPDPTCPLCLRIRGVGDAALERWERPSPTASAGQVSSPGDGRQPA